MAKNDSFTYKHYVIYPLALYMPAKEQWQPIVLITHDTRKGVTLPHIQSFPELPNTFEQETAALNYALRYGLTLIDRKQEGLRI